MPHLGQLEKRFGKGDNILHLANRVDTLLHSLCMLGAGTVKYLFNALDMAFRPLAVWFACDL